jgi:tRNA nucleotidyltransferase/poly(A) polymerase
MANQLQQAQTSRAHVDVEFSKMLHGNVATMFSIIHDIGLLDKRRPTLKETKITRMDSTH